MQILQILVVDVVVIKLNYFCLYQYSETNIILQMWLRLINKYESEYNLILKYFWPHKAAHQAEKSKIMGPHQHGGRKNHQAQDVVMLNEFIIDYHRMMHRPLLITQHDNTACFDRTVHNISNICNQKYNIPKSICKLFMFIILIYMWI